MVFVVGAQSGYGLSFINRFILITTIYFTFIYLLEHTHYGFIGLILPSGHKVSAQTVPTVSEVGC